MKQNENGLTLAEWLGAATFGRRVSTTVDTLRAAWERGECPCDWAAYHADAEQAVTA